MSDKRIKRNASHLLQAQQTLVCGGGRVVRWCWVSFQCRGVLLIWSGVGQGLTALAVVAGRGCLDIFSLVYHFSFLSPSLWETARYRLKYCLKGPLSPKQPTCLWSISEGRQVPTVPRHASCQLFPRGYIGSVRQSFS